MSYKIDISDTVYRMIRHYGLKISKTTLQNLLITHSDFPSLKSISDFFTYWNVKNYPLKLNRFKLIEAGAPFLAHLKGSRDRFVFVPKINLESNVTYYDGNDKSTVSQEEFFNQYSGIALFIDPEQEVRERDYLRIKQEHILDFILPYCLIFLLLTTVFYFSHGDSFYSLSQPLVLFIIITKFLGLVFSILLFAKSLNVKVYNLDKFCESKASFSCTSVLNSAHSKLFGYITWSEIGIAYFVSGLLCAITLEDQGFLKLLALVSTIFIVYSIINQAITIKKWCVLCLFTQLILLTESIIYLRFDLKINIVGYNVFFLIFAITILLVSLYKRYTDTKNDYYDLNNKLSSLKRNPKVILSQLANEKELVNIGEGQDLVSIGTKSANIKVTAYISLTCSSCTEALKNLVFLAKDSRIRVILVFSWNDSILEIGKILFEAFSKSEQEGVKLLNRIINNEKIKPLHREQENHIDQTKFNELIEHHSKNFKINDINNVPTIYINGKRKPKIYDIMDIPLMAQTGLFSQTPTVRV